MSDNRAGAWLEVGGKAFAIGGRGDAPPFNFKVTPLASGAMKSPPRMRPAPYLASRGLCGLQRINDPHVSGEEMNGFCAARIRWSRRACHAV